MPERPLLLFPMPEVAGRSKGHGGPGRTHYPPHGRQGQRLSPIFRQLQDSFNARTAELQQTTAGVDPEQVLVIETVGSIENFANAVKRIDGLEWMGEIETDEIAPDEDFYDEKDESKELGGRLYLVMSNNRALQEMLSLWQRYQRDPDMEFAFGLTKFRDVFLHLRDIRRWGVQDRIEETGLFDAWQEDIEHDGDRPVRFEIELWFRTSLDARQDAQSQLTRLLEDLEGSVVQTSTIEEIAYHAILAEVPASAALEIIGHPDVELIKCDSIMFLRPVGQMATGMKPIEQELVEHDVTEQNLPAGEPVVAVLDGMPMANHALLADRLMIDDPDDFESDYTVADRGHGTAMSSLIVHGDLSESDSPLPHPVYIRPIMKPIQWISSPRPEQIPSDVLVVDLIHRAVRRMFEGDKGDAPIAPSVRIISFSIGDPSRLFNQIMSPLARLLDWLSAKYRVLVVISAGNHPQDIDVGIPREQFEQLSAPEQEAAVVKAIYGEVRHRKLMGPAESINGLSVGALHNDAASVGNHGAARNLFNTHLPSPVSAFGSGYRRAIKPDLLFDGGRLLYSEVMDGSASAKFEMRDFHAPPGNKVAAPSAVSGDIRKTVHCCGTSNAAALTSRMAAKCHDSLKEVFDEQAPNIEFESYVAPLLKAMTAHGCSWDEIGERLRAILQTPNNGRQIRQWISQWLGYGVPDRARVLACTENRATVLGFGQLSDGEAHLFDLPLPPSLGAKLDRRRLTATLAWLSPLAPRTQKYRAAGLWYELENADLVPDRKDAEWRSARRGTLQHEVFEGEQAHPISEGQSLRIKVNCRNDASKIQEPVPYGLVVSLEIAEGLDIPIYDEIRAGIRTEVEIRASGG